MHQPINKPSKNISYLYKTVDILPEYLEQIKNGTKKMEFRRWYSKAAYFLLKNTETQKVEGVIQIAEVLDMNLLDEESRETVLDEGKVSEEFRENYDCRFCYIIEEFYNVQ